MLVEHTIETPHWLVSLVEDVLMDAVIPLGFIGPLGYRYWEPDDEGNASNVWQVAVYPTPNEIRGSDRNDGSMFVSGFRLDIGSILKCFHEVEEVVWVSPTKYSGILDGPEISLRGTFTNKQVWLRFYNMPPPDEPPAFAVNPQTAEATELPA